MHSELLMSCSDIISLKFVVCKQMSALGWSAEEQHGGDVDCGRLPKHTHTQRTHTQQPTRLTAICKDVIATYITFKGFFQEVLWLSKSYFCTILVSAHYSWGGEEHLRKKGNKWYSVVWTQKIWANYNLFHFSPTEENIWQDGMFSVIYHLSLRVIIVTAWWNVFLQITSPLLKKNAKPWVWFRPCFPRNTFSIDSYLHKSCHYCVYL